MKGIVFSPLLAVALLAQPAWTAPPPISPSMDSARENAFHIFNSIHSAGRQWGSSIIHNGLALIPATAAKGTLFYHGTRTSKTPPGPEWLAFEIEHSENFAWSWRRGEGPGRHRRPPPKKDPGQDPESAVLTEVDPDNQQARLGVRTPAGGKTSEPQASPPGDDDDGPDGSIRGYLHTYQANRDLHLLYVDGMGAGKCSMGTLDTQDFVLRGLDNDYHDRPSMGSERERAAQICELITSWGYDGLIRMEIGFEIIYCNFTAGLDFVSAVRRPFMDQAEMGNMLRAMFEMVRAVAQRYDGFSPSRLRLDFSRFVSGFFYPINVTNPDPHQPELPRLISATKEEHRAIRDRVKDVASERPSNPIDWQTIVDMMVSRYSERLDLMASDGVKPAQFVREIFAVTNTHFNSPPTEDDISLTMGIGDEDDYKRRDIAARRQCANFHLLPVAWRRSEFTPEDNLLHAAVSRVAERICDALFYVRHELLEAMPTLALGSDMVLGLDEDDEKLRDAINLGLGIIRELTGELRWTIWKKCRGCNVNQVCFVAMWPFGRTVDHYAPGCQTAKDFEASDFYTDNYWRLELMPIPTNGSKGAL